MKSFLYHLQCLSKRDTPLAQINVNLSSRQQKHRRFWAVPATIVFLGSNLPLLLLNSRSALADQPNVCATPGKDGSATVNGIINSYYPGASANVAAGSTSIPVGPINIRGNQTPIAKGDLILIIQMQDADINSTDTDAYGNGVGGDVPGTGTAPSPTGASGYTALNNAGRYEYAVAAGPISGGVVPIQAGTTYSYRNQAGTNTFGQRTYQVVRIPQYLNATVSGTLTTSAQWDGKSGGIVVIDVAQQLAFAAGSVIDVNGLGFRGGGSNPNPYTGGSVSPSPYRSVSVGVGQGIDGPKGEGIAGTPRFVATQPFGAFNVRSSNSTTDLLTSNYPNGDEGRGAPGNAGGGGNEHNSGGGGGANGGDGGMGGRSFNGFGSNPPQFDAYVGGFGGKAIPADPKRLILGGGGGAGDTNDQARPSGAGGGGGGLVLIRAGTVTGTGTITARGGDGIDSLRGTTPDAGGGGGAGGTVLVAAANGSTASLNVIATGGVGGNLSENNTDELDGPGAGGGGGAVYTSGGGAVNISSGNPGLIVDANKRNNTPNGATPGIAGTTGTVSLSTDLPTSISGSNPICLNQPPTTNDLTAAIQPNPGGTTKVQVPTFAGADPEDGALGATKSFRITTLPTNGILYYNGLAVTAGQVIANYDPTKLTVDPNDGTITVTFTYAAIDSLGKEDATPATVSLPFAAQLSISGNVFDDGNGSKLKDGTGPAENYTAADIAAVLLDGAGKVVGAAAIDASGNYSLNNVPAGNYTVKIIKTPTTPLVLNATIPPAADVLPTNFVATGENVGGTSAGIDAVVDRTLSVTVTNTNVTGINFGIEQLPTAVGASATSQTNPGGTTAVNVPPALFNTSTDPDGTVTSYRITAFPGNATSITIGTTTYTAANFPTAGVTVLATDLNTIKVDPIDGATTVTIPFKAIDNAGKESSNTATASIPFTAQLSISGNVFDDGNGSKLKDGTGPAENYTAADITAVLLDGAGRVVGTAVIDASGNYNLANVPAGNYTVQIIKTPTTPLVLNATIPTAVDVLPTNFVATGENVGGTAAGIDAVVDRTLSVTVTNANVTGINFGIEQLPTAVGTTATSQTNPGGTTAVNVPPTLFNTSTDPDGTVSSYRITAFPANATTITIGTTTYTAANFPTAGVTVLATDLNTIKVDPIDGATTVTIPFKAIDNAGKESSNTATASLPFTQQLSISGNVFDDGNGSKLKDGTGAAENYTAADITAVLLDGTGKVVGTAIIDASGNYSLANVPAGSYTVKIIKTPTTPLVLNATIPTAADVLPTNIVATGENIGGTAAGIDAVVDRTLSVTVTNANVTGINFGIEQLPTAVGTTATSQTNPGGTTAVNVPPALFNTSTDPDGTVTSYRITAFPANATTITIGTTTYTAANFPTAGVTVLATDLGTIKVDPIDGATTVTIPFKAIDNAGRESSNTSNASLPFTPQLSISGNVFDDGNGSKLKDGTGAAENYTATDITAVLLDGAGRVVGTAAIDASGNYSLANVPAGSYTVKIIKTPATPLVLNATIPTAVDVLPTNFVATGENVGGTAAGIDAVVDRTLSVTVTNANVTGINFGIEQLPTAVGAAATSQTNPGGTVAVNVPPTLFNTSTDPDGTVISYRITAFPTNVTSITIGATTYTAANFPTAGVTVLATALNTIKVDPIDGSITVTIPFKAIDNAGKESGNTATASLPFGEALKPELLLVKRITEINGGTSNPNDNTTLNQFVDDTVSPKAAEDNNPNWPTGSLTGAINGGAVKTGNTIEYTIYLLSSGNTPAKNVLVCDRVPANSIFRPDGYANGKGILFNIGGTSTQITNVPDSDAGQYFSPGSDPTGTYPNVNCGGPNINGAIVIKVGDLTNATTPTTPNSFSFFKFRAIVK